MPALAKLVDGPIPRRLPRLKIPPKPLFPSASLILICGNNERPSRFRFASDGARDCAVVAKARSRIKPNLCSQLRFGVMILVFVREKAWLPAFIVCGNPISVLFANGVVLGLFCK